MKKSYLYGYCLTELLLVLGIIALLMVMASPTFHSCYFHVKTMLLTNQIKDEIYLARQEAINQRCEIFYKLAYQTSKRAIFTGQGILVREFAQLPPRYTLTLENSLNQNNGITFTPLGLTKSQRGSLYLTSPTEKIRIIMSLSGRLRIERCLSIEGN